MNLRPALAIAPTLAALLSAAEPVPVAPTEATVAEAPAAAPYTADEIEALVARARSERLAEESHWLVLLHYAHGISGHRSRVDDPRFFLAPSGKSDPAAELEATLRGLLAPDTTDAKAAVGGRFPARTDWLCERLGLDRSRLAFTSDPEFEQAYKALSPRSAVLVFPAAYMNTPASMFGHTLLLVRSRFQSTLLSQAINYAAVTTENNGLIFALRGIFGLYPGFFSLQPYYQKVREYTDMDQRDIWEYELTLSEPEIRRLLLHVWEMRGIASDYFFFDENCSYNLLYLIDSARPGLALHQTGGLWVIPLDTIKAVRDAGLVADCVYRPSRSARVRYIASLLPAVAAQAARDLALGETQPETVIAAHPEPVERARIFELAAEYLQSLRGDDNVAQGPYQQRLVPILKARSAVPLNADEIGTRDLPAPPRPDRTHPSSRVSLGGGRMEDLHFAELAFRPAYHDLVDPGDGFLPGTQIEFGNVALRWYEDEEKVVLHRLDAIRLSSFSDLNRFYTPVSWRINTGIVREVMEDGDWHHHAYLDGGAGLAVGVGKGGLLYGLIQADARVMGIESHHAIGGGPAAGLLLPLGSHVLLHPYGSYTAFVLGEDADNWEVGTTLRLRVADWCSLAADAARRSTWEIDATTFSLRAQFYF